jgi:hypothetical protein
MHAAVTMARSALSFGTRMQFASRALPVGAEMKPPPATPPLRSGGAVQACGLSVVENAPEYCLFSSARWAMLGIRGLRIDETPGQSGEAIT